MSNGLANEYMKLKIFEESEIPEEIHSIFGGLKNLKDQVKLIAKTCPKALKDVSLIGLYLAKSCLKDLIES